MKCPNCSNEQESGNLCGKCGSSLMEPSQHEQSAAYSETAAGSQAVQHVNTNEAVLKAKEGISRYWKHAVGVLKKPASALSNQESQFLNGIITIGIFVIAFSLSIYFLANKLFKDMFGGLSSLFSGSGMGSQSLPFFQITSSLFMFSLLFVLGALLSVFLAAKFMGEGFTIKELLAQFGSILVPFAAFNVAAIVFGLMGAVQLTLILTGFALIYTIVILPSLVVYDRAMKSAEPVNRFYWATGASAVSMLITYLIIRMVVMDFISEIESLMNMGF